MPSNPAIPHRCGKATPQRRDESACNKTATQVRSRKSLQKTETDGRSVERALRYHGHRGLSGHKRELLRKEFLQHTKEHELHGMVVRCNSSIPCPRTYVKFRVCPTFYTSGNSASCGPFSRKSATSKERYFIAW